MGQKEAAVTATGIAATFCPHCRLALSASKRAGKAAPINAVSW
jgi:hypothetical protein